jgi:hypothetical protein
MQEITLIALIHILLLHASSFECSISHRDTSYNPFCYRKTPVVVGIDQVDAVPRLTSSKKPLMHITCHGKTTSCNIFRTKLSEQADYSKLLDVKHVW